MSPAHREGELGPWFEARYDGHCADCGGATIGGDRIRADGYGGYLCEDCGEQAEEETDGT